MVVPYGMEHPLASLSEGGGTAKAVTEGVSFVIYDTPPVCFASSPLKEGAKRVTSTPGWLLLPFRAIHLLVAPTKESVIAWERRDRGNLPTDGYIPCLPL